MILQDIPGGFSFSDKRGLMQFYVLSKIKAQRQICQLRSNQVFAEILLHFKKPCEGIPYKKDATKLEFILLDVRYLSIRLHGKNAINTGMTICCVMSLLLTLVNNYFSDVGVFFVLFFLFFCFCLEMSLLEVSMSTDTQSDKIVTTYDMPKHQLFK